MAKKKFYVVLVGKTPGIYTSWDECLKQISSFPRAKYKGFPTKELADAAFEKGSFDKEEIPDFSLFPEDLRPITNSICVDAACSGNPGKMEYRGVYTVSGTELFKNGIFEDATNNVGEFLALVHGLSWLKKHKLDCTVYSDSRTAISWVKNGKAKSKLPLTEKNKYMFQLVARAEKWLAENRDYNAILKWNTKLWGEIPADFGRK